MSVWLFLDVLFLFSSYFNQGVNCLLKKRNRLIYQNENNCYCLLLINKDDFLWARDNSTFILSVIVEGENELISVNTFDFVAHRSSDQFVDVLYKTILSYDFRIWFHKSSSVFLSHSHCVMITTTLMAQWSVWGSESCRECVCNQMNGGQMKCFRLSGASCDIFGYFLCMVIPRRLLLHQSPFLLLSFTTISLSLSSCCFPLGVSLSEIQLTRVSSEF